MYQLNDVTRVHDFGADTFIALDHLSVEIPDGEFAVVQGDLDAGGWQLLTMLSGEEHPDHGTVVFDDQDLADFDDDELEEIRLRDFAVLERACHMRPTATLLEVIEDGMLCSVIHPDMRRDFAYEALESVGLLDRADVRAACLTQVERRLASIARAVAKDPLVLLAHDPTWGLLPDEALRVSRVLHDLWQQRGFTMVIASDNPMITGHARRLIHLESGHLRVPIPA